MKTREYSEEVRSLPVVMRMADIVKGAEPTAQLILYGSRARGDHNEQSDWDLLVLLDKERVMPADRSRLWDAMYDLEMEQGLEINTSIYPLAQWNALSFTPFHHNVEQDGIRLL